MMPIHYKTRKDLKERTGSVLADCRRGTVVITNRGKPEAILQRFDEDELLALKLLESPRVRLIIGRALRDVSAGRTVAAADLVERVAAARP